MQSQDYEPVDLAELCNAGEEWVSHNGAVSGPYWAPDSGEFPRGLNRFRGVPFQIGCPAAGPRFLAFGRGGYARSVSIQIARPCNWIVIAHRLVESDPHAGGPLGQEVATYCFRYADGAEVRVPIRERFEISVVPPRWGHLPFLAVPDEEDRLLPRNAGDWEMLGRRLAEADMVWPRWFVLWAWQNPAPHQELDSLVIEPHRQAFLVAGVTTSPFEEDPFGRDACRTVLIHLQQPVPTGADFDIAVQLDRGIATYPYPLPSDSREAFLADKMRGWGWPRGSMSDRVYARVAARPSATLNLQRGKQQLAAVRWGALTERGQVDTAAARVEVVDPGQNWVHVEVLDQDTNDLVPCRVHFRSSEGVPYQPHGHHNHLLSDMETWHIDVGGDVRLGEVTYAYIDGQCQGWLPRGEVLVDVAHGFEYEPLRTGLEILPGQRELTLHLKRRCDMAGRRWFSGDSHVHFLSTQGALFEGQAEGLNVINLLQSQWGHLFTNTEDFCGRPVESPGGRTVVYTGQENRQHILGHLTLLGLKRPIMPWCSGGPDEGELGGTLETTLCHWADECHSQGGTVIAPHLPDPNCEVAALIATGRADAVEMVKHDRYTIGEYYRYLNAGYRLPLVGGTDKMSSSIPVGLYRTYVYIPHDEEFNYASWCKHLRLGRTFMTGGPMLSLSVEGAMIGDVVYLLGNGGTIDVCADAQSIFPLHSLEIIQEGQVVASIVDESACTLRLKTSLHVDHCTWVAARAGAAENAVPEFHRDPWRHAVIAHTSPIYVAVGDRWSMRSDETAQYMLTLLHGGLEHIGQRSCVYPPGTVTHHHGEEDHLNYLRRPFNEAIETILTQKAGWAREQ